MHSGHKMCRAILKIYSCAVEYFVAQTVCVYSYYLIKDNFSEPSIDARTSSFAYNYYLSKSLSKTFRTMMNIVGALLPSCANEFRGHSKIVKQV